MEKSKQIFEPTQWKSSVLFLLNVNTSISRSEEDYPGGLVVKNLLASAGDMGSIPGLGRCHIPRGKRGHGSEKPAYCHKEEPTAMKTQGSQKKIK